MQIEVPLQDDSAACGIFIIQYIDLFVKNQINIPFKHTDNDIPNMKNWFDKEAIYLTRYALGNSIRIKMKLPFFN